MPEMPSARLTAELLTFEYDVMAGGIDELLAVAKKVAIDTAKGREFRLRLDRPLADHMIVGDGTTLRAGAWRMHCEATITLTSGDRTVEIP